VGRRTPSTTGRFLKESKPPDPTCSGMVQLNVVPEGELQRENTYEEMTETEKEKLFIFQCQLLGAPVRVMVDCGSSTSFISANLVKERQIAVTKADTAITVRMTNGTTTTFDSLIKQAELELLGWTMKVDLKVLDMQGYDIILGRSWLNQQNPDVDWPNGTFTLENEAQILKVKQVEDDKGQIRDCTNKEKRRAKWYTEVIRKMEDLTHLNLIQPKKVVKELKAGAELYVAVVKPPDKKKPDGPDLREPWEKVEIAEGTEVTQQLKDLCKEYKDIFVEELPQGLPPKRDIDHEIKIMDGNHPPKKKLYRLSQEEEKVLKKQLSELFDKGFIQHSKSPYGAPVLFVKKKGGDLRMCVDYRGLNLQTVKNSYPLPRIDDMFDRIYQGRIFSSFDLTSGYHQVRIKEGDEEKTAFMTRYGQYEYKVVPFGLCNAPATFQSLMHQIFHELLDDSLVIFLDDMLTYSKTPQEHMDHIRTIFEKVRENKLYFKPNKCKLGVLMLEWLGHIIYQGALGTEETKIQSVKNWPTPTKLRDIRGFLGICSYYRKYIQGFATLARPLHKLLKKNTPWKWTDVEQTTFDNLKRKLTEAPVLTLPDPNEHFTVQSDASDEAIGAVLLQNNKPVAYISRALSSAEEKYPTHEKETLAIIYALKQWRVYLAGRKFTVFTDHQALTYLNTQTNLNNRQARWSQFLQTYDMDVKYLKGTQNIVADNLSRKPMSDQEKEASKDEDIEAEELFNCTVSTTSLHQTFLDEIRHAYSKDKKIERTIAEIKMGKSFQHYKYQNGLLYMIGEDQNRIVVPRVESLTTKILKQHHDIPIAGHLGEHKTYEDIRKHFYWQGMHRTVKLYVKTCPVCQMYKSSKQKPTGLTMPLPIPNRPWEVITMDFIVKLPESPDGFDSILVVVDKLSKYSHFIPCSEKIDAAGVAKLYFDHIFANHGIARCIVSDRDVRFRSLFWKSLHKLLGTELAMSTAYHPQTNGQTEERNQVLEQVLRVTLGQDQRDWKDKLPLCQFVVNNMVNSTGQTAFKVSTGYDALVPSSLLKKPEEQKLPTLDEMMNERTRIIEDARDTLKQAQMDQKEQLNKKRRY